MFFTAKCIAACASVNQASDRNDPLDIVWVARIKSVMQIMITLYAFIQGERKNDMIYQNCSY